MVDYKKWDKFIADLSSDEEDNTYGTRVTTLPDRSTGRVTIGPQGYHIHQEGEEQAPYDDMQDSEEDGIDYEEDVDLPPKHIFQHISTQKGTQKTSPSTSSSNMPISDRVEYIDDSTPSTSTHPIHSNLIPHKPPKH